MLAEPIEISWSAMKAARARDGFVLYWIDKSPGNHQYEVVGTNMAHHFRCYVRGSDATDFETNFQAGENQITFRDDVVALVQAPINSNFVQQVEIVSRTGKPGFNQFTIGSPNLCDATTWYQDYTPYTEQALQDSGDHLTFTSGLTNWINIDSFRLAIQEYSQYLVGPYKKDGTFDTKAAYRPAMNVNGAPVTTGYTIDYGAGTVTFANAVASPYNVTASFRRANSADFIVRCPSGKRFIPHVEINCSKDVELNGTTYLEIYAGDPDFLFTDASLQYRMPYESLHQLITLSTTGGNIYPGMGGTRVITASARTGWATNQKRGTSVDTVEIPFDFGKPAAHGKVIELRSSQYAAARVRVVWDAGYSAHGGELLNATFYAEDEPE